MLQHCSEHCRRRTAITPEKASGGGANHRALGSATDGDVSETRVLAAYRNLQKKHASILGNRPPLIFRTQVGVGGSVHWFRVRVAESTLERAKQLCSKLKADGGSCLVARN